MTYAYASIMAVQWQDRLSSKYIHLPQGDAPQRAHPTQGVLFCSQAHSVGDWPSASYTLDGADRKIGDGPHYSKGAPHVWEGSMPGGRRVDSTVPQQQPATGL